MKLFTAMEGYQSYSDATEDEVNELFGLVENQQNETAMMLESYSDATDALKNLKRVEQTRVTDREVYRVTMESLADQFGYPAGSTFTSEGIGESISKFAKKVWAKIVAAWHAVRDWVRKLFGMTPIPSEAEIEDVERTIQEGADLSAASSNNPEVVDAVKNILNKVNMDKVNDEMKEAYAEDLNRAAGNDTSSSKVDEVTRDQDSKVRDAFAETTNGLAETQKVDAAKLLMSNVAIRSSYFGYTIEMMRTLCSPGDIKECKEVFEAVSNGGVVNDGGDKKLETRLGVVGFKDGKFNTMLLSPLSSSIVQKMVKGAQHELAKRLNMAKDKSEALGDLLDKVVDGPFESQDSKLDFGKLLNKVIALEVSDIKRFTAIVKHRKSVADALTNTSNPSVPLLTHNPKT